MKFTPAIITNDPQEVLKTGIPAIGEPKKDVWTVHKNVGGELYARDMEAYGYVFLYSKSYSEPPKGLLWVDRRELAVLNSCLPKPDHPITAEDIAQQIPVARSPLKLVT